MVRREAVTSLYSEDTKPQQLQNVPNEFARREMIRTAAYTRQGDVCNIRKCRTAFPTRKLTLVQCRQSCRGSADATIYMHYFNVRSKADTGKSA